MKSTTSLRLVTSLLYATLVQTAHLAAQDSAAAQSKQHNLRYVIKDLGTLGGSSSEALSVNINGLVSGQAALENGTNHAVLWYRQQTLDIGTPGLEPRNSASLNSSAFTVNQWSQATGPAEISRQDPNGENFCGYGTGRICVPFVWQYGLMTRLTTLGGHNGQSISINNRGDVVGVAENNNYDGSCATATPSQVLDYQPVLWNPWQGVKRALRLLPGDSVGVALWINDNGQAIGQSGSCANTTLPPLVVGPHAVLWEKDGSVHDLGNLGGGVCSSLCVDPLFGPYGNVPLYINNQGQVVGVSALAGDVATHAFLWTKETGRMQDLGTLPGDISSVALGMNEKEEIVGLSFDSTASPRAFLYRKGIMLDLNSLLPADAPMFALGAEIINATGEIAGFGVQLSTGDVHGYLATPCNVNNAASKWCKADSESSDPLTMQGTKFVLSESGRRHLAHLRFHHGGGPQ